MQHVVQMQIQVSIAFIFVCKNLRCNFSVQILLYVPGDTTLFLYLYWIKTVGSMTRFFSMCQICSCPFTFLLVCFNRSGLSCSPTHRAKEKAKLLTYYLKMVFWCHHNANGVCFISASLAPFLYQVATFSLKTRKSQTKCTAAEISRYFHSLLRNLFVS